jgi:hypothetical protein
MPASDIIKGVPIIELNNLLMVGLWCLTPLSTLFFLFLEELGVADRPPFTDKPYHIMMYRVHLAMSGIPTHILVVIGSDCTYSCTIRTTTAPYKLLTSGIYHCHLKILLQITFKYQNN